jgi:tRNA (cytidine32/guanosine34-2'-O)-methyltransferase
MDNKFEEEVEDITQKDQSNFKKISYSKRDIYYRKAKEEGFRARSVYKLKEINDNYKILEGANNIIDLCAAPGSWSQMLRILTKNNPDAKIVSVDIQDIVPIEGVNIVKGDITKQETIVNILKHFDNKKVDIIIFDGAPDVTGLLEIDIYMQMELIVCSLIICLKVLKSNGKFVAKVFQDKEFPDFYYEKVKLLFDNVFYYKPGSSRNTSHETYIIAEGFSLNDQYIEDKIAGMDIDEIFDIANQKDEKVRDFLKFLCEGCYNNI